MSDLTPIKSATFDASGTATTIKTRLTGLYYLAKGSAGTIAIRNGATGGTAAVIKTPASATATDSPHMGGVIILENGLYVEITDVTSVTLFYQE